MYKISAYVRNEYGLHARPSAAVVREAGKYASEIQITNSKSGIVADAKAILELMLLVAPQGTELIIEAEGPDAEKAAKSVAKVINEFYISEEEK